MSSVVAIAAVALNVEIESLTHIFQALLVVAWSSNFVIGKRNRSLISELHLASRENFV